MTNATRYLCAAAYLSPDYASDIITDLVASHRAVAPSIGVDVGPVIRHSLRARAADLTRNIVLTVILLFDLYKSPLQAVWLLVLGFLFGFLPRVNWARKSLAVKIFAVVASLVLVGSFIAWSILLLLAAFAVLAIQRFGGQISQPGQSAIPAGLVILLWAVPLAIVVTQIVYSYVRCRTLSDQLRPGAMPHGFRDLGPTLEARIRRVEGAQYGNVLLYAGENPFLGTGTISRSWSIAIELLSAPDERAAGRGPARPQRYVAVDPVELHLAIRRRLQELNDDTLLARERITALTVSDHVVGQGRRRWDSPLIDQELVIPYSLADDDALAALIRHPQAGVRYYQRVSVCDEGQDVWAGDEKVLNGSDQGIAASGFVYVAIEGHMLYLEFVSTVMPPVHPRWQVVDLLPNLTTGKFMVAVLRAAIVPIFRDIIYAPVNTVRAIAAIMRERRSYGAEARAAREYLYGDIGARFSARGRGAAEDVQTYIQKLDAEKYTKLVERLVTDKVLEYLRTHGVDTRAFERTVNSVHNYTTFDASNSQFHGPVSFGSGSSATQHNEGQQERD